MKDVHLQSRAARRRTKIKDRTTKKKRKITTKPGNNLRLNVLRNIISESTNWNASFNAELQNCLTISLPNYVVKWSTKEHYKFSDTFNARVLTFLLCMNRLTNTTFSRAPTKIIIERVIGWMAKSEQHDQMGQGEIEKQGSLRIFVTGSVTALGVKNCEMLQDVVERIDNIIKNNEERVVH